MSRSSYSSADEAPQIKAGSLTVSAMLKLGLRIKIPGKCRRAARCDGIFHAPDRNLRILPVQRGSEIRIDVFVYQESNYAHLACALAELPSAARRRSFISTGGGLRSCSSLILFPCSNQLAR